MKHSLKAEWHRFLCGTVETVESATNKHDKSFLNPSPSQRTLTQWNRSSGWEAAVVRVTWVEAPVATSQHVAELLAAFALAVPPRGVEAQLLHQHQCLLTQVFIPVPRHPPIRIALPPAVSQWQRSPRRPHLSDGARVSGALARPPFTRRELRKRRQGKPRVRGNAGGRRFLCLDYRTRSDVSMENWATATPLTFPEEMRAEKLAPWV